jgi:hypothetical protein
MRPAFYTQRLPVSLTIAYKAAERETGEFAGTGTQLSAECFWAGVAGVLKNEKLYQVGKILRLVNELKSNTRNLDPDCLKTLPLPYEV